MNQIILMIAVIAVILIISRIIMKLLRQEDIKKGLQLRETDYTIKKSILSSHKQEKRIEKMKRLIFTEYDIRENVWKKAYLILLATSAVSILFGMMSGEGIGGAVLVVILATVVYFKRLIKVMLLMDLVAILPALSISITNIPVLILVPAVGIFNYVVFADYIGYRKILKGEA